MSPIPPCPKCGSTNYDPQKTDADGSNHCNECGKVFLIVVSRNPEPPYVGNGSEIPCPRCGSFDHGEMNFIDKAMICNRCGKKFFPNGEKTEP
jgi:DNA-directed RNA polymerase subunit RPC12/RpoP